jgi:multisubunit Na+/H+ antiporter MnhG subunit
VALVVLIIFLPWLGSVVLPCLRPILGRHLGRWALLPPAVSFLITLTIVFVFLGGPVGAHMIARAAYRSQVPLHDRTIVNEWKTIEEDIAEPHRDA